MTIPLLAAVAIPVLAAREIKHLRLRNAAIVTCLAYVTGFLIWLRPGRKARP